MLATDNLRRQRLELLELASDVAPLLDADWLFYDGSEVRIKLCEWVLKLRRYLEKEERSLYPLLWPHSDPTIVTRAARFQRTVRALADLVMEYADDWLVSESAILSHPSRFVQETIDVFQLFSEQCRLDADRTPSGTIPLADFAKS